MKMISFDNGNTFLTAEKAMVVVEENDGLWDTLAGLMNDDIRESIHDNIAPCTKSEFLKAYLDLANDDLIIG